MKNSRRILQIVPRPPGSRDGVGDYALRLADQLHSDQGIETVFAAAPLTRIIAADNASYAHIILHYVNYGYHKRGIPTRLPALVQQLKQGCEGKIVTIFHELYASAPPWRSAFWLQPWQKSIARRIAQLSDACIVSSETMRDLLRQLAPASNVSVHPVISTLGESILPVDQFVRRDPHRWAIFGGEHLLRRSLRSFSRRLPLIPEPFSPKELYVLGGSESSAVRHDLDEMHRVTCHYRPAIEAGAASEILSSCSFGWIDYFQQRNVPTDAILKSGSFASYCAHGVIPVLPHQGSRIAMRGEQMPGPYFVSANQSHLPSPAERAKISADICDWYRRNAGVEHLARGIAALLQTKS